jgi:membrane protein implicated in regulation of membrane protease activity
MVFHHLSAWFWLGLSACLLILEMLLGSGFLLCIASSAGLMFFIKLFFGLYGLTLQIILFSFFSIVFGLIWKILIARRPNTQAKGMLNQRAQQYIGREFKLKNAVNGEGKMHVDDTVWQVRSNESIRAGSKVTVIGADGTILLIEKKKK